MSAKVDAERRAATREDAVQRANLLLSKMVRLVRLFEAGLSDSDIGAQLQWHPQTVRMYRQVLQLRLGDRGDGRWREQLRERT